MFTHAHTDHIMGFDGLRRFTVGHLQPDIYARPKRWRRSKPRSASPSTARTASGISSPSR
ncbi:MAG: hypothetical protein R3F11_29160 [Verrucomicrobiales bacterium]